MITRGIPLPPLLAPAALQHCSTHLVLVGHVAPAHRLPAVAHEAAPADHGHEGHVAGRGREAALSAHDTWRHVSPPPPPTCLGPRARRPCRCSGTTRAWCTPRRARAGSCSTSWQHAAWRGGDGEHTRAGNEHSRRLEFHNHGEGHCYFFLLKAALPL